MGTDQQASKGSPAWKGQQGQAAEEVMGIQQTGWGTHILGQRQRQRDIMASEFSFH